MTSRSSSVTLDHLHDRLVLQQFFLDTMPFRLRYLKDPGIKDKFTRATDRTWFLWDKHKGILEGDREYWPLSWQGLVYWVTQGSRLQPVMTSRRSGVRYNAAKLFVALHKEEMRRIKAKFTRATDRVWFAFHQFAKDERR